MGFRSVLGSGFRKGWRKNEKKLLLPDVSNLALTPAPGALFVRAGLERDKCALEWDDAELELCPLAPCEVDEPCAAEPPELWLLVELPAVEPPEEL